MRPWLALPSVGLAIACGGSRAPSAADEAASSSDDGSVETQAGDSSTSGDEPDPPFDRSQCSLESTGAMDWYASLLSTAERGGGVDLARADADSIYVVDDCLSRWNTGGWREWEVRDPDWTCVAMDVTPEGEPIVVGRWWSSNGRTPLVIAFDASGEPRWGLPPEEEDPPPEPPPEPEAPREVTDVVIDDDGRLYVAGLVYPDDEPVRTWLSRLDPEDGEALWTAELDEGVNDPPQLTLADGRPVLAESRQNDAWVGHVVLSTFDVDGNPISSWSSLDALGRPLWMDAFDGTYDGSLVLLARDLSLDGHPAVLVLLDPLGGVRWVRNAVDVPWMNETLVTVALDPCGSVVLAGAGDADQDDWGYLWVGKLDMAAEPRWNHFVPTPYYSRQTAVSAVSVEPDGGVLATGLQVTGEEDFGNEVVLFVDAWAGRVMP